MKKSKMTDEELAEYCYRCKMLSADLENMLNNFTSDVILVCVLLAGIIAAIVFLGV